MTLAEQIRQQQQQEEEARQAANLKQVQYAEFLEQHATLLHEIAEFSRTHPFPVGWGFVIYDHALIELEQERVAQPKSTPVEPEPEAIKPPTITKALIMLLARNPMTHDEITQHPELTEHFGYAQIASGLKNGRREGKLAEAGGKFGLAALGRIYHLFYQSFPTMTKPGRDALFQIGMLERYDLEMSRIKREGIVVEDEATEEPSPVPTAQEILSTPIPEVPAPVYQPITDELILSCLPADTNSLCYVIADTVGPDGLKGLSERLKTLIHSGRVIQTEAGYEPGTPKTLASYVMMSHLTERHPADAKAARVGDVKRFRRLLPEIDPEVIRELLKEWVKDGWVLYNENTFDYTITAEGLEYAKLKHGLGVGMGQDELSDMTYQPGKGWVPGVVSNITYVLASEDRVNVLLAIGRGLRHGYQIVEDTKMGDKHYADIMQGMAERGILTQDKHHKAKLTQEGHVTLHDVKQAITESAQIEQGNILQGVKDSEENRKDPGHWIRFLQAINLSQERAEILMEKARAAKSLA